MVIKWKYPTIVPIENKRRYICDICGKECTSGKSFGGHKRIHSKKMDKKNNVAVRLTFIDNKGPSSSTVSNTVEDQTLARGAYDLMALQDHHDQKTINTRSYDSSRNALFIAENHLPVEKKRRILECSNGGYSGLENRSTEYGNNGHILPLKKTDKLGKENGLVVPDTDRYKCNICFKSFGSYQALGGHKSHHKRDKRCTNSFAEEQRDSNNKLHQCPICYGSFSTSRDIRCHKRKCKGPDILNTIYPGELASDNSHSRMLSFDLNELPPPAEIEEEGEVQQPHKLSTLPWHYN